MEGRGRSASRPGTLQQATFARPSLAGAVPAPLHREAQPCQAAGGRTLWENLTVILQLLKSINPCVN